MMRLRVNFKETGDKSFDATFELVDVPKESGRKVHDFLCGLARAFASELRSSNGTVPPVVGANRNPGEVRSDAVK